MKNIILRIYANVFQATEGVLAKIGQSRNRYINKAVRFYSQFQQRSLLAKQLKRESRLVREESMKVLADFNRL